MDEPVSSERGGRSMTIQVGLDEGEPPIGVLVGDDGIPVPFAGWLELIHAISRLATSVPLDPVMETGQPIGGDS